MNPHATLLRFAEVNDAAAATTKKLQKQAMLADYFRGMGEDADLRLAVRYAAGRAFAATDERVLNVGGAAMRDAVTAVVSVDADELHALSVKAGEIGEALALVWETRRRNPVPAAAEPLTLREIAAGFDAVAAVGKREAKREALVALLSRARTNREAAYLGKIIFGDLRTGVQEGVLQAAVAVTFEATPQQVQRCQLLVGDLGEVAVLARHGQMATAAFKLFHPVQFMLATPRESAEELAEVLEGRAFRAEDKLDGIRAQVHKSGSGGDARVAIYTRTLDRIDEAFPEVVAQAKQLDGDVLLDGEIVPYANGQVLPFGQLQKRLGRKNPSPAVLAAHPCAFIAFDVLYRDGRLVMEEPLADRRPVLEAACGDAVPTLAQAEVIAAEQIAAAFDAARGRRNEGIIVKDPTSVYSPGRRGQVWFKLKTHLPTLDCVVTAAETGHGKRRNSLSDYTFGVWDGEPGTDGARIVNVGKAFSGVTDEEIAKLTELFTELTVKQFGRVRQVKPQVVLEIACDQIQVSKRHAGGFAMRFPRIKRVRWDKRPEDADRLTRVAEIYESLPNFAKAEGGGADGAPESDSNVEAAAKPSTPPVRKARAKRADAASEPTLFDVV
ncbi:MAG: ATP-dependent ligase [Phycisphaerales bacterium]|nr:ATP-dependent ligase [Phycisphaerales bacterium]